MWSLKYPYCQPRVVPCLAPLRSPHGPASDPASAATPRHSAGADETRRRQELDAQWKVSDAGAHAKVPPSLPLPLRYSDMHKWLITSRRGGMAPWRPASAPSTLLRPPSLSGCAHRPLHPQAVQRASATPIPATELSHGLSLQHLVEPLFHRRAAELAGYERLVAHDLQSSLLGEPLMTCDHLMPGLN